MENATQTDYANRLIECAWAIARAVTDADVSDAVIVAGEECRAALEEGDLQPGQLENLRAWLSGIAAGQGLLARITSCGQAVVEAMTGAAKATDATDFQAHSQAAATAVAALERAASYASGLSLDRRVVIAWAGRIDYAYLSNAAAYNSWTPDPKDFAAVKADFAARSALVNCKRIAQVMTMACYRAMDADRLRAREAVAA